MIPFYCIIDKIFKELNFKLLNYDDPDFKLYGIQNYNYENYYLVSNVNSLLDSSFNFKEYQQDIFEKIKEFNSNSAGFLKNISWLIGVKCDTIDSETENNLLKIEEDEYCFKKTVFTYSSESLDEFKKHLLQKESNISLITYLNLSINNYTFFKEFYDSQNRDLNFYDFISKIFIKIPIIPLDIESNESLELNNVILNKIENDNLTEFHTSLISFFNSSLNAQEVYDKLMDGEI